MGGTADRVGRVKITLLGIIMGVIGSILLIFAQGPLSLPLLLTGRAIQGFSAACIMPSSMALVKTYWDGPGRQRAVSMWSIGSWGGSGLAALFGGAVVQYVGWRGIFVASIAVSGLAFFLIFGTPENRVEQTGPRNAFDLVGLCLFIVGTLGLMIVLLFGSKLGWGSAITLVLGLIAVVAWAFFVVVERKKDAPFIDFKLFKNTTFTGATISNFLLNGTIGMLIVSQQLIQLAGKKPDGSPYTAWDAGLLTIGSGAAIFAFIRGGEKLLQRFGPRKPMIWGSLIVIVACVLLMMTHLLIGQYVVLAVIAYALFGPSRILVLGPDSSLAALILAVVLPLSGGDPMRAVALAGVIAVGAGLGGLLPGHRRRGFLTELFSKAIRCGYMHGIARPVLFLASLLICAATRHY